MREYECIKPFSVPYYDIETDSYDESQFFDIEVGSLWQREDDDFFGSYTGADIQLDGDGGWIEINEEDLEKYFRLIESEESE